MPVSKRVGEVLSKSSFTSTKLGEMLGTSHTTIISLRKGKHRSISSDLLERFIRVFPEVSPRWLLTGEGPETHESNDVFLLEKGIKKPLDPDIKDLIISLYEVNAGLFKQTETQGRLLKRSLLSD